MKYLNIIINDSTATKAMNFLGKLNSKNCSRPMVCTISCSGLSDSGVVRLHEAVNKIEALFENEIWVEPATLVQSLVDEVNKEMERRGLL